jgi:putative Ca2+/H+ antiporter (TMEM165/GDT1 family)
MLSVCMLACMRLSAWRPAVSWGPRAPGVVHACLGMWHVSVVVARGRPPSSHAPRPSPRAARVQTLLSAEGAEEDAAEEREEAQEVVDGMSGPGGAATLALLASTFALVFAAEWGDKSFLATIALAAASSPTGGFLFLPFLCGG